MRYRSPYRARGSRKRSSSFRDYLLPFLILIAVGIIIILSYNLWRAIFSPEKVESAKMYIVEGDVEVKSWEEENFITLSVNTALFQGDEIITDSDSKVIIEFFDGTIMRVDYNSDVILDTINSDKGEKQVSLKLINGNLWFNKWFNKDLKDTLETTIVVELNRSSVVVDAVSVFAVGNSFNEIVRVVKGGDVLVNVLAENDREKVVETVNVGVGQEVVLTPEDFEDYWQYKSPTVLAAYSDEFKLSDWYLWNLKEDKKPTELEDGLEDFVEVEPEKIDVEEGSDVDEEDDSVNEEVHSDLEEDLEEEIADESVSEEEKLVEVSLDLSEPKLLSVAGKTDKNDDGYYEVNSKLAVIKGSISGAEKVIVDGYTLKKFEPGDTDWAYYANADYDLMTEGENSYEVYAEDKDGNKSDSIFVKIWYTAPEPVVVPEQEPVSDEEELVDDVVSEPDFEDPPNVGFPFAEDAIKDFE